MDNACSRCSTPLPAGGRRGPGGTRFCSALECRRERNRVRMRAWNAKKKEELGGANYYARFGNRDPEIHWRTRRPGDGPAQDAARRALIEAATVEIFDPLEVYERDGWLCGICGLEVDRDLAYPAPMSRSLDHVVPLSLGGDHSRANTRLAHLACNVRRGNRVQ